MSVVSNECVAELSWESDGFPLLFLGVGGY